MIITMFGFDFFFNRRFLDSLERDVACALEDWNALLFICFPDDFAAAGG